MLNLMTEIKTVYFAYSDTIFPLIIGLMAMVYLLAKVKQKQMNLLIYELVIFFLLAVPGIANLLWKYKFSTGNIHLIWGIWIPFVVSGVVATEMYLDSGTKKERLGVITLMVVLLMFGVGLDFSGEHISIYANSARVDQEIVVISDALKETEVADYTGAPQWLVEEASIRMLAPTEVATAIRECDNSIIVLYGEGLGYTPWNPEQLLIEADAYASNCLVISREYEPYGYEKYYLNAGFLELLQTEHYVVYTR